MTGGSGNEYASAIKMGPDGFLYVTGGTSSFGAGWYDIFLLELDTDGNLKWGTTWGGSSYEGGYDIAFDSMKNIYVVGESYSTSPCCAVILLKFSPSGALLQPVSYKGPATYDTGYSLTVDANFNVIIVGISWDYNNYPTLHNSILVLKYDPSGNLTWQQNWSSPYPAQDESASFHAVTTDPSGNVYIAGRHSDQCQSNQPSQCDWDAVLLKLDPAGNFKWAERWGTAGTYDTAASVVFNTNNQLQLSGVKDSLGTPVLFILGYDTAGNILSQAGWVNGTVQQGSAAGMTLDSVGNAYLASSALNNIGSWGAVAGTPGTLPNSLITNSYLSGAPSEPTSQLTNPTVSQHGTSDTGGGGSDLFVAQSLATSGSTPSFAFPLSGSTPYTTTIFSVFDHNMQCTVTADPKKCMHNGDYTIYGCDGKIQAYTEEAGLSNYGTNTPPPPPYCAAPGYAQDLSYTTFYINGFYKGSGSNGLAGSESFLNYDGHPGIDYSAPPRTEVLAATSGTVHYPTYWELVNRNMYIGGDPDKFNVLELDPSGVSEYKIFYLHIFDHPRTIALVLTSSVTGQDFLASAGNAILPAPLSPCTSKAPTGTNMISGHITSNGAGLSQVTVTVTGMSLDHRFINPKVAVTDLQGGYLFSGLPAGYYHVEASKAGYVFAAAQPNLIVPDGSPVTEGQVIALSFNSGNCIGPHLHFEVQAATTPEQQKVVKYSYIPVDPYGWDGEGSDPYPRITAGMTNQFLWKYSPYVASTSPITGTSGVPFTLTINGMGFDSGAQDCLVLKGSDYFRQPPNCISGTLWKRSGNQVIVQETLQSGTYFVHVLNGNENISNWRQLVIQ